MHAFTLNRKSSEHGLNSSYFSKMALAGFQYEPVCLDVNKACFEEQNIPNTCYCMVEMWEMRHNALKC